MDNERIGPNKLSINRRWRLSLLLALTLLLLALAAPWLLWAYHLSAAGPLLERGLAWPSPRQVDSLPAVANAGALRVAQDHLEQARRWRPSHPHAYRLGAYAAMAAGDWSTATRLLEDARTRAPHQPLLAWEAGLAYEQLWLANPQDTHPKDAMLAAWRAGGFDTIALHVRAEEARLGGRVSEAQHWDERATLMEQLAP